MTSTYNRSQIYDFNDLTEVQQLDVLNDNCFELSDAHSTSYVKHIDKDGEPEFLPLSMFMRTDRQNNFTHGIYSLTSFSAYFLTFCKSNDIALIAYKHF